jgi:hypothetical protein
MGECAICYVGSEELLKFFELSNPLHDEMPTSMEQSLKVKQWGNFEVFDCP